MSPIFTRLLGTLYATFRLNQRMLFGPLPDRVVARPVLPAYGGKRRERRFRLKSPFARPLDLARLLRPAIHAHRGPSIAEPSAANLAMRLRGAAKMLMRMARTRKNLEILKPVVRLIAVAMTDDLVIGQPSSESLLDDVSVLVGITSPIVASHRIETLRRVHDAVAAKRSFLHVRLLSKRNGTGGGIRTHDERSRAHGRL